MTAPFPCPLLNEDDGIVASDQSSSADHPDNVVDPVREADLDRVLVDVPRGTLALCGAALFVVLLLWSAMYFGVFLPRGPVS